MYKLFSYCANFIPSSQISFDLTDSTALSVFIPLWKEGTSAAATGVSISALQSPSVSSLSSLFLSAGSFGYLPAMIRNAHLNRDIIAICDLREPLFPACYNRHLPRHATGVTWLNGQQQMNPVTRQLRMRH